ncbi:MAG: restriction endonuclease [Deltaproteobacteria bacterium]|nr:restriction endonuclease [Deltaproteobacteria bacterium]
MSKRLSAAAIQALKEALSSIYWYKSDLRSFLQNSTGDRPLISSLNWNDSYKRQVVSDLIDDLCADQDGNLAALTRLCYDVTAMRSFPHLQQLDGGEQKATKAREAVEQLRQLVDTHTETEREEEAIRKRQEDYQGRLRQSAAVREKLDELKHQFMGIAMGTNPKQRGFELERFMLDLFELFDLDPKASFRNVGEQIDGAFSLEGTDYLFEAKWQQNPVGIQDLDAFSGKIQRKLENTLGLFLSMNGFSMDAVDAHSRSTPNSVLMDGADLHAVLEQRIDFVSLLIRKKRHAAQTGRIFLPIHEILV